MSKVEPDYVKKALMEIKVADVNSWIKNNIWANI